ncbi:MAG: M1 family metallopeptidase [Caldicoprobacterales bacterium]|jgi:hypothetical protein|nr:M1 family metallopeptidase [Clostridiales bacterium]
MKVFLKRHAKFLLTGILIITLLLAGLSCTGWHELLSRFYTPSLLVRAGRGLNQYYIQAEFDPDAKTLECYQKTEYINRSEDRLTHLYFHLHPNAYLYENKPVFEKRNMSLAYPGGFSPGSLDMIQVRLNGKEVPFVTGGYSENILMLPLEGSLDPGGKTIIEMEYIVKIPYCLGRFGHGDKMYKLVNWYPHACVYDQKGWNLDPYYAIGDPFYSDAANYHVTITAPADFVIAATGEVRRKKGDGSHVTWEIDAPAVRDFAWLAGKAYQTASRKVGRTRVVSYYFTPEAGQKALDYAAEALSYFNDVFGEYPYPRFSVVEADFFIGGMEYPNLIMMDSNLYKKEEGDYLELVTVHETAHQWWYGLVGSDQIRDAWMDEGLTEYSTVLYYGHRYGREKEEEVYDSLIGKGKYRYLKVYYEDGQVDETIHRPAYEFSDWLHYDLLVYGKGAMLFHSLREEMGDELFYKAIRIYFHRHRFQNAGKMDLIRAFNQVTEQDWQPHFDQWLYDQAKEYE